MTPTLRPAATGTLALALALACSPNANANPANSAPSAPNSTAASTAATPATAPQASHPLWPGSRLQGQASLRYLGWRIYHAQLWVQPGFRPELAAAQPLLLELHYQRALSGAAIAERSLQEMRRAGPITEAQSQRWLAQMQRLFPDVQAGDRISGQHLPGQGAHFWRNGQALGQIDDAEFALRFFGIWLAPSTSEPAMRQSLLAQQA